MTRRGLDVERAAPLPPHPLTSERPARRSLPPLFTTAQSLRPFHVKIIRPLACLGTGLRTIRFGLGLAGRIRWVARAKRRLRPGPGGVFVVKAVVFAVIGIVGHGAAAIDVAIAVPRPAVAVAQERIAAVVFSTLLVQCLLLLLLGLLHPEIGLLQPKLRLALPAGEFGFPLLQLQLLTLEPVAALLLDALAVGGRIVRGFFDLVQNPRPGRGRLVREMRHPVGIGPAVNVGRHRACPPHPQQNQQDQQPLHGAHLIRFATSFISFLDAVNVDSVYPPARSRYVR